MIRLLIITVLFCITLPVNALDYAKDGFPPLKSEIRQEYLDELSYAEKSVFGKSNEKQCIGIRLNRLETALFNRTYPRKSEIERINSILANYNKYNPTISGLSKLEKKVFNRSYEHDTTENRIARLEELVIGTIQSGDLKSRYNKLAQIVPKYSQTQYVNPIPYCAMPNTFTRQGIARAITNFFTPAVYGGYPTGWTPQIVSPYSTLPPYQRGFANNRGWIDSNMYRNGNVGVHILD